MSTALKNPPNSRAKGKIIVASSVYQAISVHFFQKTEIHKILSKGKKINGEFFALNLRK